MPAFSRILAPIAFSARCEGAAQYAEALACHFHSELVLLHVVMPVQAYALPDAMAVAPEVMDEALAQAKTQLDQFLAEVFHLAHAAGDVGVFHHFAHALGQGFQIPAGQANVLPRRCQIPWRPPSNWNTMTRTSTTSRT